MGIDSEVTKNPCQNGAVPKIAMASTIPARIGRSRERLLQAFTARVINDSSYRDVHVLRCHDLLPFKTTANCNASENSQTSLVVGETLRNRLTWK